MSIYDLASVLYVPFSQYSSQRCPPSPASLKVAGPTQRDPLESTVPVLRNTTEIKFSQKDVFSLKTLQIYNSF